MRWQLVLILTVLLPVAASAADGDEPAPAIASEQAPAALVEQILSAAGRRTGLCVVAGWANRVTGSSQSFVALHARSGRTWGADDPRLFAKAGRDAAGKSVNVQRAAFGTKPIRFGREFTPAVVDGGVFVPGYRGGLFDPRKYLKTQFGASAVDTRKWAALLPSGTLIVAGDKVLIASAGRLTALARDDGKTLGQLELPTDGAPLRDGVAAAENSVFVVTTAGEVVCLTAL